ncbi:MAG: transposase [Thaumarchaeota archaeon]|nr:transposase [Nitrososphaerota archaeon]MDE1878587.1 transposase [Nitrososphaerota archaeon]
MDEDTVQQLPPPVLRDGYAIQQEDNESLRAGRAARQRTFDRRFKVLPMGNIVSATGKRFVEEGLADCTVAPVDISLVSAKGRVWHRSEMLSNTVRPGIDRDARWGFAKSNGCVFGYKIHMSCSTGSLIVSLSASVTTANVQDNLRYRDIVEPLPESLRYVPADLGYDD